MNIYKEILDVLNEEYHGGATYQEMAKDKNVSHSYLRGLMRGVNPPEKLSLDVLFKLFPHATIRLHGDSVIAENSGVNNGVLGVNHGTINSTANTSAEAFRDRAIKVLMDLVIPPDALLTVLTTLKDLKI